MLVCWFQLMLKFKAILKDSSRTLLGHLLHPTAVALALQPILTVALLQHVQYFLDLSLAPANWSSDTMRGLSSAQQENQALAGSWLRVPSDSSLTF